MASNMMTMSISKSVDVKKDSTSGKSQDSSGSISNTFQDILKQYHSNQSALQNQNTIQERSSDNSSRTQSDKTKETVFIKEKSASTAVRTSDDTTNTDEDISEELKNYQSKIESILQNYLGVSQEQIQQTMQSLNLTTSDLLNTNNLASLVSALSGGSDMGSLLLNENFQGIFTEVSALNQSLCKELGINLEQLTQMLQQNAQVTKEDSQIDTSVQNSLSTEQLLTDQTKTVQEKNNQTPVSADQSDLDAKSKIITGMTAQTTAKTTDITVADDAVEEPVTDSMLAKVQNQSQDESAMDDSSNGKDPADNSTGSQKMQHAESGRTAAENAANQIAGSDAQTFRATMQSADVQQAVPVYQTQDLENLISQLTENVKMQLNQTGDITSMEMQLNPEHLGKLYLHITEKEGTIHAQIAASNEAVKEALASQTADLKQSLNQQGIKVQAIEITVATHQFEQNLEGNQQGQMNQNQQEPNQSERRNSLRADYSESDDVLTEAETLAVRMMQDHGNAVDLMA